MYIFTFQESFPTIQRVSNQRPPIKYLGIGDIFHYKADRLAVFYFYGPMTKEPKFYCIFEEGWLGFHLPIKLSENPQIVRWREPWATLSQLCDVPNPNWALKLNYGIHKKCLNQRNYQFYVIIFYYRDTPHSAKPDTQTDTNSPQWRTVLCAGRSHEATGLWR